MAEEVKVPEYQIDSIKLGTREVTWLDAVISKPQGASQCSKIKKSVEELRSYGDDWDFLGAEAVSSSAIDRMMSFVDDLYVRTVPKMVRAKLEHATPDIFPGPNGSVNAVWHGRDYNVRIVSNPNDESVISFMDQPGTHPKPTSGVAEAVRSVIDLLSVED